ncbi:universal stress protein [Nitrosopumilus ureiphilus]|uniref:Universal stress protein n=1 Tax=Nitrosopumilus ureiphilus TaxID=1470067 RepID=A0A7D5R227_9ARCH|nr:universal stress protein [Nitrosopumilus ureiphilus]QLH05860.1 universal stress protein [Nitrosopumilus ureiphilus]
MIKKKINKILVALDGSKNSQRALDMGIFLARKSATKLIGINVISNIPKKYHHLSYPEKPVLLAAENMMESAKKLCAQSGILFERKIDFGDPGPKITKFAESLSFDIIIIGTRGMSGIKEKLLGSISNHVVHKSSIPVMIVK